MSNIIWHEVIKDMHHRNEVGAKKYNRYLTDDSTDDMLQHAYEEALDLAVYLKTEICKRKKQSVTTEQLEQFIEAARYGC